MKEEKIEWKERGRLSGFANREKFPGYAIAKKSMYYLQKASVPGPTAWKTFVTQIPTPLQILNTPCSP